MQHTTVFGRVCRQQLTEQIIGIHIDIDNHNDIDRQLNKESFCTIGILQQVLQNSGRATSGIGINKLQHPEWASPRRNNKNGLQQSPQRIQHRHGEEHQAEEQQRVAQHCLDKIQHQDMELASSARSSIKRCGFNIGIEMTSRSSRSTRGATTIFENNIRENHVHNNPANIVTSMVEGVCTSTSGSTTILISSTFSTSCHHRCSLQVPSKGATTTKCTAMTSTMTAQQGPRAQHVC